MVVDRFEAFEEANALRLPRILCLHGGGTNAKIFRVQCRVLEKAIKPHFRLVYAQAPFPSKPGPDVVSVYASWAPFLAWLDPKQPTERISHEALASIRSAIADDNAKGATGDFVGLLGFSQGAKIAASLLRMQELHGYEGPSIGLPLWRFAILLAGRGPLISPAFPSLVDLASARHSATGRPALPIFARPSGLMGRLEKTPTVHVHGHRDPGLSLHRQFLLENFDRRQTKVIEWDGEHRVPIKLKDVSAIVDEALMMAQDAGIPVKSVR